MFAKTVVSGPHQHPLFRMLTSTLRDSVKPENSDFEERLAGFGHKKSEPHEILWNFEKFLISRSGKVIGRFSPDMTPDDPILIAAIEKALGM
ncbi:MAG: glutathione peroxidase, partial [Silvanigrellaceae bacterium]